MQVDPVAVQNAQENPTMRSLGQQGPTSSVNPLDLVQPAVDGLEAVSDIGDIASGIADAASGVADVASGAADAASGVFEVIGAVLGGVFSS